MTFGSRESRTAYHLPLWWLWGLGLAAWAAWHQASSSPGTAWLFFGLVFGCLGLRALVGVRVLRGRDDRVRVHGVFGSVSLEAATCCFPVIPGRGRGFAVHVFAADREHRIKVATTYSKAGADHLAAWLGRLLLDKEPGGTLRAAIEAGMADAIGDPGEPRWREGGEIDKSTHRPG